MATPFVGWMYADRGFGSPVEIFNNARTLRHLAQASATLPMLTFGDIECEVLYKDPCDYSAMNFLTPSTGDVAPWWDGVSNSPSSHAYGFIIKEWTGLGGDHISRGVASVFPRGARFSTLSQGPRIWKITTYLFGRDALALEELFRWLEETLIDCDRCAGSDLWIRTTCPDGYSDDYGLATVSGVELVEGLRWEEPPVRGLGCFVRLASFTLGVSDPLYYSTPSTIAVSGSTWTAVDHCSVGLQTAFGCPTPAVFAPYRKTAPILAATRGRRAPVVTMSNSDVASWSFPFRVGVLTGPALNDDRGSVYVRGVPPGSEVKVDCARRRVYSRRRGYRRPWEPADDLLHAHAGLPVWSSVDCSNGLVFVEPTILTGNMEDVTLSATAVQRWGGD